MSKKISNGKQTATIATADKPAEPGFPGAGEWPPEPEGKDKTEEEKVKRGSGLADLNQALERSIQSRSSPQARQFKEDCFRLDELDHLIDAIDRDQARPEAARVRDATPMRDERDALQAKIAIGSNHAAGLKTSRCPLEGDPTRNAAIRKKKMDLERDGHKSATLRTAEWAGISAARVRQIVAAEEKRQGNSPRAHARPIGSLATPIEQAWKAPRK